MSRRPPLVLTVLFTLLLSGTAAAQQSPLPTLGARVRVTAAAGRNTGTLLAYRGDTLLVRRAPRNDTVRVARADVMALEVATGKRRRVGRGAALGLAGGAVFGVVAGAIAMKIDRPGRCEAPRRCSPFSSAPDESIALAAGGVLGAGVGTIVGAAVGARLVDRWEPVALPLRWSRGRAGLTASLAMTF